MDMTCVNFGCEAAGVVSEPPGATQVQAVPLSKGEEKGMGMKIRNAPTGVKIGGGAVWVSTEKQDLQRIDPELRRVVGSVVTRPRSGHVFAPDLALSAGALWVPNDRINAVRRVDPTTDSVTATIAVERPVKVLSGDDAPWVLQVSSGLISSSTRLSRIDPDTNRVSGTITLPVSPRSGSSIAIGEGAIWVADSSSTVYRLDPSTGSVVAKLSVPGAASVAVAPGAVWVANTSGKLFRVDPSSDSLIATLEGTATNTVTGPVNMGPGPVIVIDGDWVWVVGNGEVSKVDSKINRVVATGQIPAERLAVVDATIDRGVLWLLKAGDSTWTALFALSTDEVRAVGEGRASGP
jgi:hypothetical protein